MSTLTRSSGLLLLVLSLSGLLACNGIPGTESAELAPQRPSSTVSGFVVDDAVDEALINIYAFDGGIKGGLLASTTTASDGAYTLEFDSVTKRPVLIEARGGSYVELSTGQKVVLKDDEVLKAVAINQPGQSLSLMVTPLTHLVVALVEYQLGSGVAVEEAIAAATVDINELFGFDVLSVYPRSIADQGSVNGISDEHLYGFFLSALSSWTKRISEQNGLAPHQVYNSIGLSQILFNELASDSLLDGKANINNSVVSGDLALGVVGLNANTYRISFAQHMLAMAAGNENLTGISVEDLLPRAFKFLNSQNRIFAGVPVVLDGDQVGVSVNENLGAYRRGVFEYAITLGSPDLISSVSFSIDGVELPVAVVPGEMKVPIDSRQFQDGERTLTMTARDWLGNTVANVSSTFRFDNTAPFVNVTSGLYTNDQSYILSGELVDNGSGVSLFEIQGQTVPVNADNSWSVELQLDAGANSIDIVLRDWAGNDFGEDLLITPDQTAPLIDSSSGHGAARFLNANDQVVDAVLADENINAPVYIETNKIDLDGLPITRASLEQGAVPYFSFSTHDPVVAGVSTAANALDVKLRYERNGAAVSEWRTLSTVAGEYLIPLASETLHSTWHQATPDDEHVVHVQVSDKSGNVADKLFSFRAAFVVLELNVDNVDDLGRDIFAATAFSNRDTLHDRSFAAVAYSFTNTGDEAIYVQPGDAGGHVAERKYQQLVREHKVRQITTPMWRVGVIENVSDMCLATFITRRFEEVNKIYQFNGADWAQLVTEAATTGELLDVFSDTPTPPVDSELLDVNLAALFDNVFAESQLASNDAFSSVSINYSYDYLLNITTSQGTSQPVYVANWQRSVDYTNPNIDDELVSCDSPSYFKQFNRYSFQSEPGYPKDTLSGLDEQKPIAVSGFSVMNTTTNTEIIPISGWYRIPAGHSVTISKRVQTPAFTVDDDVEVANAGTEATYTPRLYDQSISWSVKREINLTAIHDAGEDSIFLMPGREFSVGEGVVNYSSTRP